MLQLLALGAPAREAVGSVEASALLPLACEGEVRLTPSQWLERWKSQHAGTDTFKPASHPGLLPQPRVPRLVMQMARNTTEALLHYSAWMATWIQLNPEYDYGARLPCMSTPHPPHLPAHTAVAHLMWQYCSTMRRAPTLSTVSAPMTSGWATQACSREPHVPTCSASSGCGSWAGCTPTSTPSSRCRCVRYYHSMRRCSPRTISSPNSSMVKSAASVVPQLTTLASWG